MNGRGEPILRTDGGGSLAWSTLEIKGFCCSSAHAAVGGPASIPAVRVRACAQGLRFESRRGRVRQTVPSASSAVSRPDDTLQGGAEVLGTSLGVGLRPTSHRREPSSRGSEAPGEFHDKAGRGHERCVPQALGFSAGL